MAETAMYMLQQAFIAYAVSSAVAAMTPPARVQGPRLNDRRLQTSSEGVVQPTLYGCTRVAGQLIDGLPEFEERVTTEEVGGKAGGPGVEVTNYAYKATVAVALCRIGPNSNVVGVRRIWADDDLLFDISTGYSGTGEVLFPYLRDLLDELGNPTGERYPVGFTREGVTLYLGNQVEPDPVLESIHGVGRVPAYVGQCYLVFDRFDCTKWGRFPNITAEVITAGGFTDVVALHEVSDTYSHESAYNSAARALYWTEGMTLHERLHDGTERVVATSLAGELFSRAFAARGDHILTGRIVVGQDTQRVDIRNRTSGAAVATLTYPDVERAYSGGWLNSETAIIHSVKTVAPTGQAARWEYYLRTLNRNGASSSLLLGTSNDSYTSYRYPCVVTPGRAVTGFNNGVHVIDLRTMTASLWTVQAGWRPQVMTAHDGIVYGLFQRLDTDSGEPLDGMRLYKLDPAVRTATLLYEADYYIAGGVATDGERLIVTAWNDGGNDARLVVFDLTDAESTPDNRAVAGLTEGQVAGRDITYEPASSTVFCPSWSIRLDRLQADGIPLSAVARSLVTEPGIDDADVHTDLPSDPLVVGFKRTSLASARDTLQPLTQAYGFDVIDVGYGIKLRERGGESVVTIHEDELLALEGEDDGFIEVTLAQDSELPSRVNVGYTDRNTDYAPGSQPAQRRLAGSTTVLDVELPIVFDGNAQPRAIADRLLIEQRLGSRSYRFVAPFDYVELEPGDPVTLQLRDGSERRILLTQVELSYDALAVLCSGVAYDPSIYRELPVQTEAPHTPPRVASDVRLELLELPALNDSDASTPVVYAAAVPYVAGGWVNSGLFRSIDGSTFSLLGTLNRGTVGSCVTALPSGRQCAYVDRASTLQVRLPSGGSLASTTWLQLLNGQNAAAVVKSNGQVEVIQWQTATLQPDGSYVLSDLLNGRLGTEHAVDGHGPGELFVLLTASQLNRVPLQVSELGAPRTYAGVRNGQAVANAEQHELSASGRNLRPYSPCRVRGERNGAGDLTLTWQRRSRIRGNWRAGQWAPLDEPSERYEIEVLNVAGVVVRTLSSTTPSVTYPAAQQVADFGSVQSAVATRVYQISAVVGRGFPAGATV